MENVDYKAKDYFKKLSFKYVGTSKRNSKLFKKTANYLSKKIEYSVEIFPNSNVILYSNDSLVFSGNFNNDTNFKILNRLVIERISNESI